jgi:hypothetical protein
MVSVVRKLGVIGGLGRRAETWSCGEDLPRAARARNANDKAFAGRRRDNTA